MKTPVLALCTILAGCCWSGWCNAQAAAPGLDALDKSIETIAQELASHLNGPRRLKVAVVDFVDANGDPVSLGAFLAEELTTKLFSGGTVDVVERRMLAKVLEEQKLGMSGLVEPNSIKRVGNLLGIDALVIATMADFGTTLRINARALSVESGVVMAAVSTTVGATNPGPAPAPVPVTAPIDGQHNPGIIFEEDFSKFSEGDFPPGYGGLRIVTDARIGKNVLQASKDGEYSFEKRVTFPDDFRLSLRMWFNTTTTVSLISENGQDDFQFYWSYSYDEAEVKVPGGATGSKKVAWSLYKTVQLVQTGDLQKVYVDGVMVASLPADKKKLYRGFAVRFTQTMQRTGNDSDTRRCQIASMTLERMFPSAANQPRGTAGLEFSDNFASMTKGQQPEGYGGWIINDAGRLAPVRQGEFEFSRRGTLPAEFTMTLDMKLRANQTEYLRISFPDAVGDSDNFYFQQNYSSSFGVTMPDRSSKSVSVEPRNGPRLSDVLRIVLEANVYKVYKGDTFIASAQRAKSGPHVGFTVTLIAGTFGSCEIASMSLKSGVVAAPPASAKETPVAGTTAAAKEPAPAIDESRVMRMAVKDENIPDLHRGVMVNSSKRRQQVRIAPSAFSRPGQLVFTLEAGANQVLELRPGRYSMYFNGNDRSTMIWIDEKRADNTFAGRTLDFIITLTP